MKKGLSELVFIIDRSGSMGGMEGDTIGGFNSMLERQKREEGDAVVTTVLFDNLIETLHDRCPINGVAPITEKDYFVRGCTAMLDAVGSTVERISHAHAHTLEAERPEKTLVVITTDGLENASREYTREKVKRLIDRQRETGWEFIFLGANIDSVAVAGGIGISAELSVNYVSDPHGVGTSYAAVSKAASRYRACRVCEPMGTEWREEIDDDYAARSSGGSR